MQDITTWAAIGDTEHQPTRNVVVYGDTLRSNKCIEDILCSNMWGLKSAAPSSSARPDFLYDVRPLLTAPPLPLRMNSWLLHSVLSLIYLFRIWMSAYNQLTLWLLIDLRVDRKDHLTRPPASSHSQTPERIKARDRKLFFYYSCLANPPVLPVSIVELEQRENFLKFAEYILTPHFLHWKCRTTGETCRPPNNHGYLEKLA